MLVGFPAINFQPLPRLLNRYPITRMIPVVIISGTWSDAIYYMHNEEIWRFLNKLKAIITSGLGRFISSKEIFPPSRFYFSNANAGIFESRRRVCLTSRHYESTVCQQRSECKTLDSEEPLKWRSHERNNLMRSKCLCCTLTVLVVLSR